MSHVQKQNSQNKIKNLNKINLEASRLNDLYN